MASAVERPGLVGFLTRTRGRRRLDWTDWLTYGYLLLGVLLMFGPVLWLVLSSFKTEAQLLEFPPGLLPYGQMSAEVQGHDEPLPLFRVQMEDGSERMLAQVRRIGIMAQMVDPAEPDEVVTRQHQRPRSRCASSRSPGATTPSCSASSTSAATCGTACSSPSSRR